MPLILKVTYTLRHIKTLPALLDGVSCRDTKQSGSAPEAMLLMQCSLSVPQNEYNLHLPQRYFQARHLQNLASLASLSLTVLEVLLHSVNQLILRKAIHWQEKEDEKFNSLPELQKDLKPHPIVLHYIIFFI